MLRAEGLIPRAAMRITSGLFQEVIQYRSGRALITITKVTARLSNAPAAAGQSPDIAGVSQPSASGQTVERVCR
jgi:hypothetical protein